MQSKSQKAEISDASVAPGVSVPAISSDFAIIDVKQGRGALAKLIRSGGKVLVRVDVLLDNVNSHDDGTSIEFSGQVMALTASSREVRS